MVVTTVNYETDYSSSVCIDVGKGCFIYLVIIVLVCRRYIIKLKKERFRTKCVICSHMSEGKERMHVHMYVLHTFVNTEPILGLVYVKELKITSR